MIHALLPVKLFVFLKTVIFLSSNLDVDRLTGLNEQLMLPESQIYCLKTACYAQICVVRSLTHVPVYNGLLLLWGLHQRYRFDIYH